MGTSNAQNIVRYWSKVRQNQARIIATQETCKVLATLLKDSEFLESSEPEANPRYHEILNHLRGTGVTFPCARCNETIAVLISLSTSNGGRAGVGTAPYSFRAAEMIERGSHRLATPSEAEKFHAEQAAAKRKADAEAAANRIKVQVLSGSAGEVDVVGHQPVTEKQPEHSGRQK